MPYYTRSSGRKSVSSDSEPSTPLRRASSSRDVQAPTVASATPSPTHPRLRDLPISKEDAQNEVLMTILSTLADQEDQKPMATYDMAKVTSLKANILSTCIRAHLRRESGPHLLIRHDPLGEGSKIPSYSLNLPLSPSAQRAQAAAESAAQPSAQPAAHTDMELDDDDNGGLHDDFELDIEDDAVKTEDHDDFFEAFSSPAGSASPVITPPPPLSSSIPRLRSHFVDNLTMSARGISPDNTSDGSSPPSTPRSPSSPLVAATTPLSPTTGILSHGFKAMLLHEPTKQTLDAYGSSPVLDVNAGFFPTMTMVGFQPPVAQEDYITYKQAATLNTPAYSEPVSLVTESRWETGEDWMMGPESMPLDELDRELTEAWH